jgi:hypothetical protein
MISLVWILAGVLAALVLLVVLIFSMPLVSFWARYLRIKISGGGLILVKWRSKTDDYYKIGKLGKLTLRVHKRYEKVQTSLTLPPDRPILYRSFGIITCDLDEAKNSFCTVSYEAVAGFDEETYENIVIRALMSPEKNINWKLLLIGMGIVAVGIIALGIMLNQHSKSEVLHQAELLKKQGEILASIVKHCIIPAI